MKKTLCLFMFAAVLLSCNSFYKAVTINNPAEVKSIETLQTKGRFFILHADSTSFAMENISLVSGNKMIKCLLTNVPDKHTVHLNVKENKKLKYRTGGGEYNEAGVLNEVHFYIGSGTAYTTGSNEIVLDKISKIEILEKDKKKTRRNHVIAWGTTVGIVVVVAALAISSSLKNWK